MNKTIFKIEGTNAFEFVHGQWIRIFLNHNYSNAWTIKTWSIMIECLDDGYYLLDNRKIYEMPKGLLVLDLEEKCGI